MCIGTRQRNLKMENNTTSLQNESNISFNMLIGKFYWSTLLNIQILLGVVFFLLHFFMSERIVIIFLLSVMIPGIIFTLILHIKEFNRKYDLITFEQLLIKIGKENSIKINYTDIVVLRCFKNLSCI